MRSKISELTIRVPSNRDFFVSLRFASGLRLSIFRDFQVLSSRSLLEKRAPFFVVNLSRWTLIDHSTTRDGGIVPVGSRRCAGAGPRHDSLVVVPFEVLLHRPTEFLGPGDSLSCP